MTPAKLSDKVVLVKLTMKRAALTKRDNYLTDKVQRQEGDASLTVLTKLFRDKNSPINTIMSKFGEVYAYHKKNTIPYIDAGPRMLPNAMYFEYAQEMKHLIAQVDKMLDTYTPVYDQLVQDDVMYRNAGHAAGRACPSEYPSAETFRESMSAAFRFQPMPDAKHFLFDLSPEDEQAFAQAEVEAASAANSDTVNRMLKPLASLLAKLKEYQGEKGERFHSSLVANVIEGCDLALKLAINPSKELVDEITYLRAEAKGCMDSVEVLKGSANARDAAKRRLEEVAAKMSAFQ